MLRMIDRQLNRVTMYRLVLYYLIGLLAAAWLLCVAGALPYDPYALLFTAGVALAACGLANAAFAWAFGVPANVESAPITALILALIITPIQSRQDIWFVAWAGVWAMAAKYMLAIRHKHLFNPAAFAVALTALTLGDTASWWVGNAALLPFVALGGALVVRRLRRADLVLSFAIAALATVVVSALAGGQRLGAALQQTVVFSPLVFFACVIVTEPLTTPPTRRLQILYGALVGLLFVPQLHIGGLYTTPELAILAGNLLSFLVSPKVTRSLTLARREALAPGVYDLVFEPARPFAFAPGQYMEWTLGHADPDARGNRRYFTLASSPTEPQLRLGVKFYPQPSSFKRALAALGGRGAIVAAQLAGDFVLPENPAQPCVFIAGGIGITPFRSMLKYLVDTRQPRPIVLFYGNNTAAEIVYQDVLGQAERELGIRTVYTVRDGRGLPPGWRGQVGDISAQLIAREVPDYQRCWFYISGPPAMVDAFTDMLATLQVRRDQIKTDFFAGLA